MKRTFCLILAFLFLSGCAQQSQTEHEQEIIRGPTGQLLDSLLTPYVGDLRARTDNDAGLAIGVTQGSDIVYAKSFGYADVAQQRPVTLTTKFHIASLSKPFVAVAALKLAEQGRLDLDAPIRTYVPELSEEKRAFGEVTVRQILTHTSGIPRHISVDDWLNPVTGSDALEQNLVALGGFSLVSEPGNQYSYSNAAFDVLGLIISRIVEGSFFEFVEQEVFAPIGMANSTYIKTEDGVPAGWANAHAYGLTTQVLTPYPYNLMIAPSSSVKATITDMSRWALFHLEKGTVDGRQVLRGDLYETLVTPQYETPWGQHIGLSWYLQEYLGRPIIMHTGESHGFESIIYIYPEEDLSIVILANRSGSRTGRLVNATSEILFGEEPKAYQVSAIYPYTEAYRAGGRERANELWGEMLPDTTDAFYADEYDLLASAAILENGAHWKESQDLLEFYLGRNANSTYAWRLLGNARLNLGDTAQAIASYERT
ncbi:MAG: serine hydrolase domain-containing protein, partial [Bacteroidota bacterium]